MYNIPITPPEGVVTKNDVIEDRAQEVEKYQALATKLINDKAGSPPSGLDEYQEGAEVWLDATHLKVLGASPKLSPRRYGPFEILKQISPVAYKLALPPQWKIHDVFHASLLHPYTETKTHGPNFPRPAPDLIDGEMEYEVERIINHRRTGKRKKIGRAHV